MRCALYACSLLFGLSVTTGEAAAQTAPGPPGAPLVAPGAPSNAAPGPVATAGPKPWEAAQTAGIVMASIGILSVVPAVVLFGVAAATSDGAESQRLAIAGGGVLAGGFVVGLPGYLLALEASRRVRAQLDPGRLRVVPVVTWAGGGLSLHGSF